LSFPFTALSPPSTFGRNRRAAFCPPPVPPQLTRGIFSLAIACSLWRFVSLVFSSFSDVLAHFALQKLLPFWIALLNWRVDRFSVFVRDFSAPRPMSVRFPATSGHNLPWRCCSFLWSPHHFCPDGSRKESFFLEVRIVFSAAGLCSPFAPVPFQLPSTTPCPFSFHVTPTGGLEVNALFPRAYTPLLTFLALGEAPRVDFLRSVPLCFLFFFVDFFPQFGPGL